MTIPIADLLGAGVLTIVSVMCVILAAAVFQYVRHAGRSTEHHAATDKLNAQNTASLIAVQRRQQRLMRHIAVGVKRVERNTDTSTKVLRQVARQLKKLTQEQATINGNAPQISNLVEKLDRYLEGKAA